VDRLETDIQEIPERYTNAEKLGAGGMGVVYKAYDSYLNKPVAIKMVLYAGADNEVLARFQREAKLGSSLSHPNIITVLDFGITAGGKPYMVMDFVEGKPLDRLLKEKRSLSLETALPIFAQIARAVGHAHGRGVLHRDLKPSNILLTNQKNDVPIVKILDFGLAKAQTSDDKTLTKIGSVIGSPLYLSPEQAKAWEADERSDIYSFGCLMYETLTGRPPIKGDSALETITLKTQSSAPDLDDSKFPPAAVRLVAKCLKVDPTDRFQDINDVVSELNKLLERRQPVGKLVASESILLTLKTIPDKTGKGFITVGAVIGCLILGVVVFVGIKPFEPAATLSPSRVDNLPPTPTAVKGMEEMIDNKTSAISIPLDDEARSSEPVAAGKNLRRMARALSGVESKSRSLELSDEVSVAKDRDENLTRLNAFRLGGVKPSDSRAAQRAKLERYLRKNGYEFSIVNELRNLTLATDRDASMAYADQIIEHERENDGRVGYCLKRVQNSKGSGRAARLQVLKDIVEKYPKLRYLRAMCLVELGRSYEGDEAKAYFQQVLDMPDKDLTRFKIMANTGLKVPNSRSLVN